MASVTGTPEFHAKTQRRKAILTKNLLLRAERNRRIERPIPTKTKPMPDAQNQTPPPATAGEDKTVAIIAYITLIGFIVAIIVHMNKKTKLGAFHLRQMLGFILTSIAVVFCEVILVFIPVLGWLCFVALWASMLVLWILGLVAAINGQMNPMPVVGPLYQKWFGTTFD
jgi:uncharacterized membrane protein